jgi:hypothetical protein
MSPRHIKYTITSYILTSSVSFLKAVVGGPVVSVLTVTLLCSEANADAPIVGKKVGAPVSGSVGNGEGGGVGLKKLKSRSVGKDGLGVGMISSCGTTSSVLFAVGKYVGKYVGTYVGM